MDVRIRQLIENLGLTQAEFADKVGIDRSTLSNALRGRNQVSINIIKKIHETFPRISMNWLMFGEGEAYPEKTIGKNEGTLFDEISFFPETPTNRSNAKEDMQVDEYITEPKIPIQEKKENASSSFENTPAKKVIKIMVFYSDNTFDTFSSDTKR
ncbi:helix-turn-helix domain-containing protein [Coprobacter tertius]|uniref:Helix-turn-helix domain-containing protein n=1 Tax=Coprobacter tertius TaxID=2944915 RepID=A0ABT1MHJ3_9BACT|nr:helix-turn-helix transcriptional regulator [Coprobacter tertius]MCP9612107.1 helix-turn-helix domain-containing protein [Coprobacter tertius]